MRKLRANETPSPGLGHPAFAAYVGILGGTPSAPARAAEETEIWRTGAFIPVSATAS
jgi:hypothetical protein